MRDKKGVGKTDKKGEKGSNPSLKLPFEAMKQAVLGKSFDLSLVFANRATLKKLNRIYRGKNEATDILSFPLGEKSGEIFICLSEARKQAHLFGYAKEGSAAKPDHFNDFIGSLFIHGLLHLKGHVHGSKMEREEAKFLKKFRLSPPK